MNENHKDENQKGEKKTENKVKSIHNKKEEKNISSEPSSKNSYRGKEKKKNNIKT